MLLGSKHEDHKNEEIRAECFEEDSLSVRRSLGEASDNDERAGEHALHECCCDYTAEKLSWW